MPTRVCLRINIVYDPSSFDTHLSCEHSFQRDPVEMPQCTCVYTWMHAYKYSQRPIELWQRASKHPVKFYLPELPVYIYIYISIYIYTYIYIYIYIYIFVYIYIFIYVCKNTHAGSWRYLGVAEIESCKMSNRYIHLDVHIHVYTYILGRNWTVPSVK